MTDKKNPTAIPFDFRGNCGTPISYETIVPGREVFFLRYDLPYGEEERSGGAPATRTFCYTGYIRGKQGTEFVLTYFSNIAIDGHHDAIKGTGVLVDGGCHTMRMTYDPAAMKFWKTGDQYSPCDPDFARPKIR